MQSNNETVAEIAKETRSIIDCGDGVLLSLDGKQVSSILCRFEVAHEREIAAKDAEIEGLQHTLDLHDLYADEECEDADTARIVAEEETAEKDAEIAELRRRLEVAEKALTAIVEDEDCFGWHNPVNISRSALAVIRGEGDNNENK